MSRIILLVAVCLTMVGTSAADKIYMHKMWDYGVDDLRMFDTQTGVETVVGSTGADDPMGLSFSPVAVPMLGGGFWPAGTLFGLAREGGLYALDTNGGAPTLIGNHGLDSAESFTVGLDGTFYAADSRGHLFSISSVDASTVELADLNVGVDGLTTIPMDMNIAGFGTAHAGDLLAVDSGSLIHIDINTYLATTFGAGQASQTLEFTPNGTLYSNDFVGGMYTTTLDPIQDTFIGSTSIRIDGMAAIPEPTSMLLLSVCAVAAAARRR